MYQYMDNQLQRTLHEQAVMEKTQTYVNEWVNALGNFDEAYRRESTKLQTKTIEQLDEERDPIYSGLHQSVKQALKSPIEAQRLAAEKLSEPFERYKVNVDGEYEQETMRITQLCQTLDENMQYSTALQTLGLKEWETALKTKNQEFQTAMNARTESQAGYVKNELGELRRALITAYRQFVVVMNAISIYEGDEAYERYIDKMNAEVSHYKQIIDRKKGKGGEDDDPEPEPEPEPENPE